MSTLRAASAVRAVSAIRVATALRAASPPTRRAASPLRSLVRSMAQSAFRKAFAASPARALQGAGITGVPQAQIDVLAKVPADQLEIVTSVLARLREAAPGRILSL